MTPFEKSKKFVYRNARPLDLARWKYHFEDGSKEEVLNALSVYQNDDGGFAYAIEPDNWNVNSTPISTWYATEILSEIDFTDKNHPILQGILKYLGSGKDFIDGKWLNTVPSNNNYPHAIWWECNNESGVPLDNPTVALAGFLIRFADKNSIIYEQACRIAKEAVDKFINGTDVDMHDIRCYINLLNYCELSKMTDLFDTEHFKKVLIETANSLICTDTEKWNTDYVCKPSMFFDRRMTVFKEIDRELVEYETELIIKSQLDDGSFPVTWCWYNDYREFEISQNWWKSNFAIKNMLYLKEFDKI